MNLINFLTISVLVMASAVDAQSKKYQISLFKVHKINFMFAIYREGGLLLVSRIDGNQSGPVHLHSCYLQLFGYQRSRWIKSLASL